MVTESFITSCMNIVIGKSKTRKDKSLYRDIIDILGSYKNKENDIPIVLRNKFDCLNKICKLKLEEKSDENVIDSLSLSEKYKNIIEQLSLRKDEEIPDNVVIDCIRQIRLRKKLNFLMSNYDKMSNMLDSIRDSSFESIDDLVLDYENTIKSMYSSMTEQNRCVSLEATSSLDLAKDDYSSVISKIIEKYERKNVTPTGFTVFDNYVLNGGFEPSRLYVIAGAAGSGKSTLLGNFIVNSVKMSPLLHERRDSEKNVYVYVTLENTIEEALLRIYQSIYSKTASQAMADIVNGVDIKKELLTELEKNNSTIILKYYAPGSISTTDLMMLLDDVIEEYGRSSIRGLYLDYLDLLRTDVKYDVNWIEIGHIALSLKALAVEYTIPVITPTHLNSTSYGIESSKDLNLSLMSKSIQKVEHADFVLLQVRDPNDENLIHTKVGKNRSGKANLTIDFKVNFQCYKFLNGFKTSSNETEKSITYSGTKSYFDNFEASSCL